MGSSVIAISFNPCGLRVWTAKLPLWIANQETPRSVPRNVTNQAPLKRTACPGLDQEASICTVHCSVSHKRPGSYTNACDHGGGHRVR